MRYRAASRGQGGFVQQNVEHVAMPPTGAADGKAELYIQIDVLGGFRYLHIGIDMVGLGGCRCTAICAIGNVTDY